MSVDMASSPTSNPKALSPPDPLVDPPPVAGLESLDPGELRPERVVAPDDLGRRVDRVGVLLEVAASLQVHELAGDVDPRDVEVVLALSVGQPRVHLPGLGIHEVCRERPGIPPEQGVRQGDVPPPEAVEVQG
jgi:hypothetical protein